MIGSDKVAALIKSLAEIVTVLDRNRSISVHQRIDQFYYMQKVEELKILLSKRDQALENLANVNSLLDTSYATIMGRWSDDSHWLNHAQKEGRISG